MAQNIATTDRIDAMVDAWIKDGRFANRSEAFRAGIFALKEKVEAEAFDPDYVTIVRELDRLPAARVSRPEGTCAKLPRWLGTTAGNDLRGFRHQHAGRRYFLAAQHCTSRLDAPRPPKRASLCHAGN